MKYRNYSLVIFLIAFTFISFIKENKKGVIGKHTKQHYPSGVSGGFAGAPSDQNCTVCHSGSTQSGAGVNLLALSQNGNNVTSYVPGEVYTVSLTTSQSNSVRGFQAVAMNSLNQISGSIAVLSNECAKVLSGRATHNQSTSSSCGSEWKWEWTAPSTDEGQVTFYVSTLAANGNGSTSGDQVYLSQHVVGNTLGFSETSIEDRYDFRLGYNQESNNLAVNFDALLVQNLHINLTDITGKSVYNYRLGNSFIGENSLSISLPNDLKNGMYIVNFFIHNNVLTKKIYIQN